ncbi:MAG TPA: amylo-alpha-1,6-glucosidase [Bryobacteraceae bacterium]
MRTQEVIRPQEHYYILATESAPPELSLVLKGGDTFAVLNRFGDIDSANRHEEGIYHAGTRFVSCLRLLLVSGRPMLLSSTVREDNVVVVADLTNPDVYFDGKVVLPRGTLHIMRRKFIWENTYYERIRIHNYAVTPVDTSISIQFDADYADIFEVRGQQRPQRGVMLAAEKRSDGINLGYRGLDGVVRRSLLRCTPEPELVSGSELQFDLHLEEKGEREFLLSITCEQDGNRRPLVAQAEALITAHSLIARSNEFNCHIDTSNDQFDRWVRRCEVDVAMMLTPTPYGIYPYAGIPWFCTPFGRDGIITALECMWLSPGIARGVLSYLSATQAMDISADQDAEPGKILHEARDGEMPALGEVPFRRYYGSVDSTPLFVLLAAAYFHRTGDREFLKSIWPHVASALDWIDRFGDLDQDGFVEYDRRSSNGLVQQGWKDSHDSVFHADGTLADGPIALCEVQGYVYAAKQGIAGVAEALGLNTVAAQLRQQALDLRDRFEKAFWCEEIGIYALALDGKKQPCRVRTSNAGQCLFTGIADSERAQKVAASLAGESFFSGWGVRTLANTEARYNPMSYHNGSVWPHDNAMVAAGLARYGRKDLAARVLSGMLAVATYVESERLPELFCGFSRRLGKAPTAYPVACSPQTWAAAAVFMLLQSCLGLSVDGAAGRVVLTKPVLPPELDRLSITNLPVGDALVDLNLFRQGQAIAVTVVRQKGEADVVMLH